jgi:hypothetical protein
MVSTLCVAAENAMAVSVDYNPPYKSQPGSEWRRMSGLSRPVWPGLDPRALRRAPPAVVDQVSLMGRCLKIEPITVEGSFHSFVPISPRGTNNLAGR